KPKRRCESWPTTSPRRADCPYRIGCRRKNATRPRDRVAFFISACSGRFWGRAFFLRHQVLGQTLEPHHQRRVALNLNVFVLDALHKRQLLVLGRHGGISVGGVLEAKGKGRLLGRTAL